MEFSLTPDQSSLASAPLDAKIFLRGPAGCGKTTAGAARLEFLLSQELPLDSILVLTPQRTLQEPYARLLHSPEMRAGGEATLATVGGLARRMIDLFWPLAAEAAGFARPDLPPVFLTLETAQYFMAQIVRPLLEEGYFDSLTISRTRLYAQILDNLSKSAGVGFPHTEIGERLDAAWMGDPSRRRIYADAQECASRFRAYCLEHNLLDFSLQLEIFWEILWRHDLVRGYLTNRYRHLIYDNAEEDLPRAHDLIEDWLPSFDSALILFDEGSGYRRFLGADPISAERLAALCEEEADFRESFVMTPSVAALSESLMKAAVLEPLDSEPEEKIQLAKDALVFSDFQFFPQTLDWVAEEIASLLEEGIPASEIAVLSPYLSDALRFSLMERLEARGIPARSHRPSRSLRDEPAAQTLLTWAAIAHPQWGVFPDTLDVAHAWMKTLEGMDLVRARLLAEIVYRRKDASLSSFDQIRVEMQERITYTQGERYTRFREWILAYRESEPKPLDHFLRALFGEVLSQPGFAFHRDLDSARVAASLVESTAKFRRVMESAWGALDVDALGREYLAMLQEGVLAAQYLVGWQEQTEDAVLIAPAYTFLLMNRPVSVQFWLNPGSEGWSERLFQPLTHPYVLSRQWETGRLWMDADEVRVSQETLAALVSGLLRRCRSRLYLGISALGESGFEQRGALLKAFQRVLQGGQE